ncbi:MAG: hypothetical protein KKH84_07450, partial [Proteobacteria bacterium]|nr:hypothetical protein [Pseudomonadota bacterium]MBU4388700.1 hypothetical protein [Pseudomonadota bacterium]MBU4420828.1 hypothetical protein [Pseudomonadota bacterium]MCG2830114.1 hypothetical protein [Desulfobacteraceae bacterium]
LCTTPIFAQFWSLRGAKRRGNLVDYQQVVRLLRFARNDNTGVMQSSLYSHRFTEFLLSFKLTTRGISNGKKAYL